MSYIIWDGGKCLIFNSKDGKKAWDYIYKAKERDPNIDFNGWSQSVSGNNFIAVLSEYDTIYQYDKAAPYLQPTTQCVEY